ncbi:MAG: heme-binding protein [Lachnospiraceae bacterium]|nr:heme-binding protein [Lachnospiraceae bacterium]
MSATEHREAGSFSGNGSGGRNEQVISEIVRSVLAGNGIGRAAASRLTHRTFNITLDSAELLMKKVEAKARDMGMKVVTAVADAHGNPVAVRCMDGAFMGSYDVALNKTYTVIAFQMSTEALGKLSQPGEPLYGIQYTNGGRIVIFGGGVPLKIDNAIIGAFGVSGGTAEQDTYLAHYAEEVFAQMAAGI